MKINKKQREELKQKYNGRCSYCGCELDSRFHIDHIEPIFRNWSDKDIELHLKRPRGDDTIENYNPSCPRCNRWKSTFNIEQFRNEIQLQIDRLNRDSPQFRMARDYRLLEIKDVKVRFYFETIDKKD